MYSIEPFELGIACIVFTLYISGKLWMYYSIGSKDTNDTKGPNKGVIKRGPEWPE
jgi:hypothetical protein